MYVINFADPVYHLALDERFTLCMVWIGNPNRQRRYDDWQLAAELSADRFMVLCCECERIAAEKNLED